MPELPTFAAGFDERSWRGTSAILFIAPPSPLLTGFVDRRSAGRVDSIKHQLLSQVNAFIASLPAGHGDAAPMRMFVEAFAGIAPHELVITAEQERDDLGSYEPAWRDRLSSIFMMGIPNGRTTLKLYEQTNQRSHELHLRMPQGHYAASYSTIHESAFQSGFQSPPVVPAPGPAQEGRSASYPWKSFGNMAKSFRWVA